MHRPSPGFAALPPGIRGQLLELPDRSLDPTFIAEILALPELLARSLGRRVIVTWDEFQALGSLTAGRKAVDAFTIMRSAWQRHERVAYVVSGSERRIELLTEEHSPFFQHFSLMELGPFTDEDGVGLLVDGAPEDRPIPRALAEQEGVM